MIEEPSHVGPVAAYHIVFGCYGFWLPNDPRGSGSRYVASGVLYRAGGKAMRVEERRRSRAGRPHAAADRERAKTALARPAVRFDGRQALAAAKGIEHAAVRDDLTLWALAVMPDHTHLVLARRGGAGRGARTAEAVTARLKAAAAARLRIEGLHPFADRPDRRSRLPTVWQGKQWVVFLRTPRRVRGAIRYVRRNPLKSGLPEQHWSFVDRCDLVDAPGSPSPLGGASAVRSAEHAPPSGDGEPRKPR